MNTNLARAGCRPDLAQKTNLPFIPLVSFPPSLEVVTRKTTTKSSTSLPDCIIFFASIALLAYRYPPKIPLCLIAQHHQPQWLNTPTTKWISSFGQSCDKPLKSCTTYFHLRVSPRGRSYSHASLTKRIGANEVLLGLNTVESKVAYLVQIIATELYKASKAISPKVRFRPTPHRQALLTCNAEHLDWSQ